MRHAWPWESRPFEWVWENPLGRFPSRPAIRGGGRVFDGWSLVVLFVAAVMSAPIVVILAHVFVPAGDIWAHLAETVLPRYVFNTLWLFVGVGAGTLVIGVGCAWLVTMCRFPGAGVFEWALLLPFAVPAYVLAYAYTGMFEFAGPVQTWLREAFGWGRQDYWFPGDH